MIDADVRLREALAVTAERHGPSLYALVTENGRVVSEESAGGGRLISSHDQFRIGSITKVYVAALVLRLAQDGVLGLDDTVQRWLGDIVPGAAAITVEVLLRLRSGLPDYVGPMYGDPPDLTKAQQYWTPRQLIEMALTAPGRLKPDTAYRYSNTDFILLGMIIEAATGQSVEAQLYQRVFEPLELRDTTFPTVDPRIRGPHPTGHVRTAPGMPYAICPEVSPSESWTSGAIVATGRDLAQFCDGLLGGTLLDGAWLNRMTTGTQILDEHRQRGLGIVRFEFTPGTVAYGHQGGVPGYTSVVARTEGGRSVVVLQNGIDMHDPLSSDNEFMQVALAM